MKQKRLGRVVSLLLTVVFVLSCFSGCSFGTDTMAKPQPAVHTPEGTEVTLHILTEVSRASGMMSDLIEELVEKYSESHENVTFEIEFLPESYEERNIRLEQLRIEIMAGKGPDVYLIPTKNYTGEALFNNLELSMRNGIFHEISAYYNADNDLHKEELNEVIMDAGTYGKARYILPLRYDFPVIMVDQEKLQSYGLTVDDISTTDKMLDTVLKSQDSVLANSAYIETIDFDYFFPQLVDYENREVLVTDVEVADFIRQFQAWRYLYSDDTWSADAILTGPTIMTEYQGFGTYWTMGDYLFNIEKLSTALQSKVVAESLGEEIDVYPLYSADGSLIAHIEYWCAVGSNCEYPDIAYEFLREFLTRETQWELNRDSFLISLSSSFYEDGIPVRSKGAILPLMESVRNQVAVSPSQSDEDKERAMLLRSITLEESDIPIWDAEIDQVRFVSYLDNKLYDKLNNILHDSIYGGKEELSNAEIDEMAKEFVTELRYLMAEG